MDKHFHEEMESSLQGETKLFSFRPQWSIFSKLGILRPCIKSQVV